MLDEHSLSLPHQTRSSRKGPIRPRGAARPFQCSIYGSSIHPSRKRLILSNPPQALTPRHFAGTRRRRVIAFQELIRRVPVADTVVRYACSSLHEHGRRTEHSPQFIKDWLTWGAGPRASILNSRGKTRAFFPGVTTGRRRCRSNGCSGAASSHHSDFIGRSRRRNSRFHCRKIACERITVFVLFLSKGTIFQRWFRIPHSTIHLKDSMTVKKQIVFALLFLTTSISFHKSNRESAGFISAIKTNQRSVHLSQANVHEISQATGITERALNAGQKCFLPLNV